VELCAKLNQSALKRVDSAAEPRLGQPAVLEGEVIALDGGLGARDFSLQTSELGMRSRALPRRHVIASALWQR
jgi:hypothetical protein